jgi:uncharacterized membrane protein
MLTVKKVLTTFIFLFSLQAIFAQTKVLLSGKITDEQSGESLIGASVYCTGADSTGAIVDAQGYYKIYLLPGTYLVRVSYIGYKTLQVSLVIKENTTKNFRLEVDVVSVGEVEVRGQASDKNVKSIEMSTVELSAKTIKQLPVIFGEMDVLKTITLLPGIKSGGEGSTGFYVRGGGPDQNLVLLDGAVVYNASHLLGFFSIFNGDAVESVEVIKGGMPANYGGRLSSIVSVDMKEGDKNKLKVNGGVGLISSRLQIEGPIQKDKSSFVVSARRTYGDVLARPFLADSVKGNTLYFYDLNAKLTFNLTPKDRLYFIGYLGRDVFKFVNNRVNKFTFGVNWGNKIAGLRWNHTYNSKLSSNISLIYNDYDLKSSAEFLGGSLNVFSGLKDVTAKADYFYVPNKKVKIKYGGQYIYHTFIPGILSAQQSGVAINQTINRQYAHEGAAYVSFDYEMSARWYFNGGLRYSMFDQVGPYKQPTFDELGTPTGQYVEYSRGTSIKLWHGAEPRFSARYVVNPTTSLKASYTHTLQYLHLATSSSATLPTDLWVPSSKLIKPQIADQVALGLFKNFKKDMYETSIEAYYKPMQNQIEFKPGAQLFFNQNLENEMVFGKGLSYGAEFLLKKTRGKTTGWIGYTWSKTTRTFNIFNNGNPYYYRYDRRHDISVVVMHQINKKWNFNFVFVYGTGNVLTLPQQRFTYNFGVSAQTPIPYYNIVDRYVDIANFRMPAYHRADISFNYTPKPESKKFQSSWNFSVYNIYSRANPYFIYFDPDITTQTVKARMVYLFPIIPSVTWNYKF